MFTSNKCNGQVCHRIPCKIKEFFFNVIQSKLISSQIINPSILLYSLKSELEDFIFENIFDYLQVTLKLIEKSPCHEFPNFDTIFGIHAVQSYLCQCGNFFDTPSEYIPYLLITVEKSHDFSNNSIENVLKYYHLNKIYRFCNRSDCSIKKSTKKLKILAVPDYLILRFEWTKVEDLKNVYNSIIPDLKLSNIFHTIQDDLYKLLVIAYQDDFLYHQDSKWQNSFMQFQTFSEIIHYLISKNLKVSVLIYEKQKKLEKSNEITSKTFYQPEKNNSESNQKLLNSGSGYNAFGSNFINKWQCSICRHMNPETQKNCTHCSASVLPDEKRISTSDNTKITSELLKSPPLINRTYNFTKSIPKKCEKCGGTSEVSRICSKCNTNFANSSYSFLNSSNSSSQTYTSEKKEMCARCNKSTQKMFCKACFNESSGSKFCEKCRKTSVFLCSSCFRIIRPNEPNHDKTVGNLIDQKRARSCIAKKCCKCGNPIKSFEENNCPKCKKKNNETVCKSCNISLDRKIYICNLCIKKKN